MKRFEGWFRVDGRDGAYYLRRELIFGSGLAEGACHDDDDKDAAQVNP